MRRFILSMFVLVMILGVFGGAMLAQDGGQAGWVDATFADITGRAPNYYSQTVRVRGVIADFISTNVFVLRDPTSMEAPGIIVINNSGQQIPNVYVQGQEVLVTGRIHPSFDALAADPTLRIASHFENAGGVAGGGQTAAMIAEGQGGQPAGGQAQGQGGAETGSQQNVAPAEGNTLQATPTSEEPQLNTTGGEDANVASGDAGAGNVNAPMLTTPSSAQDGGAGSDMTAATAVGATPGTDVAAVATGTVMAGQGTAAPAAGTAQPGAEGAQATVNPSQPTAQSGESQPSELPPDALAATSTAAAGPLPTAQMPEATQTAASVISQTNQVSAGMPYLWEDTLALVYGDFLPADIRSFAILEITTIGMLMYPSDVAPEANTSG